MASTFRLLPSGSIGSGSGSGSVVVAVVAVVSVVVAVVSVVVVVAVDCVGSVGFVTSEELVVPDVAGAVVPLVTSGLPPQETSATAETRNNAASMSANTFFINFPSVPDFVFILKYTVVHRKSQCSNRGYFVLAGFYLGVVDFIFTCSELTAFTRKEIKKSSYFLVLLYDQKYQKSSKRAFTPVSATPTNALCALVNSPLFENSPCRLAATSANKVP